MVLKTDAVETMKIRFQFFMPTLAAAMALALVGCGGGSRNSEVVPASGTVVKTWSLSSNSYPKHMAFLNDELFIANHGPTNSPGGDEIIKINLLGSIITITSIGEPIGIAVKDGSIFVSGRDSGNNLGIIPLSSNPLTANASIGANYYGLTFLGDKAYVIDGGDVNAFNSITWNPLTKTTISVTGSFHQGIVAYGNFLYVSNTDGTIKKIDTSNNDTVHDIVFTPLNPFSRPNAMSIDGNGNMYVISAGDTNGDGGYISKVNLSTFETTTFVNAAQVGLCGAAGLAINDGYIYVSNGTCSTASLQHRILKIKL